jgi:N-acetyl-anhydromuramyl-L-alanine amidase AmpD
MQRLEVSVDHLIMLNGKPITNVASNNVKTGHNACTSVVLYNSGKSFKTVEDIVAYVTSDSSKHSWSVIIGRDEDQLVQINTLATVANHCRSSDAYRTVSVILLNYGKLHCVKNTHFNMFKRKEADIFIHAGTPYHSYSKHQIHNLDRLVIALNARYGISEVVCSKAIAGNHTPTPQIMLDRLNALCSMDDPV